MCPTVKFIICFECDIKEKQNQNPIKRELKSKVTRSFLLSSNIKNASIAYTEIEIIRKQTTKRTLASGLVGDPAFSVRK